MKDNYLIWFLMALELSLFLFVLSLVCIHLIDKDKAVIQEDIESKLNFNLRVVYEDINQSDIKRINNLMNGVNQKYFLKQEQIVFVNQLSPEKCGTGPCIGVNHNAGEIIFIEVGELSDFQLAELICHELLHTYIFMDSEEEEILVTKLAKDLVCYNDFELKLLWRFK